MYGEFGAMRFPRQHHLGQHLIHERFGLPTTPFPMDDEDTFIHLNGRSVRRSEFTADSFDFGLPERRARHAARGHPARRRCSRSSSSSGSPAAGRALIERYDRYSLLGWLIERGVSEPALVRCMGPLLNLEGRFHFSLVEWFSHWHEDVFGDLEYIDAGADTLADAFAPLLLDDTRLGAEVQAIEQGPDGVIVRYRDAVGDARVGDAATSAS